MSGLILPSATAALAYKRLDEIADALADKISATGYDAHLPLGSTFGNRPIENPVVVRDTERRVQALAAAARDMFRGGGPVPFDPGLPIPPGMSKFAVLGASVLEWPAAAELFGTGKPWVADAMRRGTPDPNLSHVAVGTTAFAVAAAAHAVGHAGSSGDQAKARAYGMGLMSAIANEVIVSPVERGIWESRTNRAWRRGLPGGALAHAERRVRASVLGRRGAPADIAGWLPAAADVPASIYDGYIDALQRVYGFPGSRPAGFADFEAVFGADGDPLTAQRLRSASSYLFQRTVTATWGWPMWWLVLSPGLLAVPLSLLIGSVLPNAKHFFDGDGEPGERGAYEILTLGMGIGNLAPVIWSMYLWSQVADRTGTFVNALVMGSLRTIFTVAGLATHHIDDLAAGVRWGAIFAPQLGVDLYALVRGIIHTVGDRPDLAFVHYLNTFPTMSGLVTLLFAELMKLIGLDTPTGFWVAWIVLTVLFIFPMGILVSVSLAESRDIAALFAPGGQLPIEDVLAAVTGADPAGPASLYDDSTLWRADPSQPPDLDQLRYPAGARWLVRIWWPGDGTLEVAHDDHTIRLRLDGAETTTDVHLSFADLSAAALADRLRNALAGLEVRTADEPSGDALLPYPHTVDDPGDEAGTLAEHDAHAADFVGVGTTAEDAYVIRQAPRADQSTRFGPGGPATSPLAGFPLVPGRTLADLDTSAIGLASELAALMCMGLAPTIAPSPIAPGPTPAPPVANPNATEVYQVFRRWNLDERRVNEWRMLVHGGAASEKPGAPADHEPGMRDHPNPAGYASPAPDGEALANRMGWLPAWRAWLRVATDPAADTAATTADASTPFVPNTDGSTSRPTNAELSEAVRFLLDLLS